MGLIDSPLRKSCEAEEETSAHVLWECEAQATLRHTYLGFFFLGPENVRSLEAILNFIKEIGLLWLEDQFKGHKGPVKKA
jgi:hypothetical protein